MSNENQTPENCTHNCDTCGASCPSKTMTKADFLAPPNKNSKIKKIIGVVSGKGGVGKSWVTSLLAATSVSNSLATGILDADITGPSIPKMFGVHTKAGSDGESFIPVTSDSGVSMMSVNLVLDDESDPVIWRGPIIAGVVKQFYSDVAWSDIDVLYVDMPPGTGDVPLTVFQSLPLDGIVVVTSPQDLVSMIVTKAIRMAEKMDIPVLGIVENMSYVTCPDCGKKIYMFGEGKTAELAKEFDIENILTLPADPDVAKLCDEGKADVAAEKYFEEVSEFIGKLT